MKIHVGADHAGFQLKSHLAERLASGPFEVVDHGTDSAERVDYPTFAAKVARAVQGEPGSLGLIVCGSGIGVSMTANRFDGVRAVVAANETQAVLSRQHNDANVLCLGERLTTSVVAERILEAFLGAGFEGGRHEQRVALIDAVASAE